MADVGDFGKYGLLRHFIAPGHPHTPGLSLGIVWYRVPNEDRGNDGKYVEYLSAVGSKRDYFRECDPDLYDALQAVISKGERSVSSIRQAGIFPWNTVFFEEPLSYESSGGLLGRNQRLGLRRRWLDEAVAAVKGCALVFLDPDNGLEAGTRPYGLKGPKYVFFNDVSNFLQSGNSVIIYHHLGRQGTAREQIARRFEQLQQVLPPGWSQWALQYHRGTSRVYFVLAAPESEEQLWALTSDFLLSSWSRHFDLVKPRQYSRTKLVRPT